MTIFVVVIGIPALMIMLSMALPARVNRATNLVVASLQIPLMVFNAVGESWEWASFYGLSIGTEVLILAFILRSAWTWPRHAASLATLAAGLDSQPLRTPQQARPPPCPATRGRRPAGGTRVHPAAAPARTCAPWPQPTTSRPFRVSEVSARPDLPPLRRTDRSSPRKRNR